MTTWLAVFLAATCLALVVALRRFARWVGITHITDDWPKGDHMSSQDPTTEAALPPVYDEPSTGHHVRRLKERVDRHSDRLGKVEANDHAQDLTLTRIDTKLGLGVSIAALILAAVLAAVVPSVLERAGLIPPVPESK